MPILKSHKIVSVLEFCELVNFVSSHLSDMFDKDILEITIANDLLKERLALELDSRQGHSPESHDEKLQSASNASDISPPSSPQQSTAFIDLGEYYHLFQNAESV